MSHHHGPVGWTPEPEAPVRVRLYKCCDPACKGYPKGHRHRETCDTWNHLPAAWRRSMVDAILTQARHNLRTARSAARDPDLLARIDAALEALFGAITP